MKIVKMISYEESEKYIDLGFSGGFFNGGMRWKDYIETKPKEAYERLEVIRKYVIDNNLKINGPEHQEFGIPLFDDDIVTCFTYRGWGDLLAGIWSEEENEDYDYMSFYC
jgi:hypothetical protein